MVWPSNEEAKEEENENQYVMVQYIAQASNAWFLICSSFSFIMHSYCFEIL